MAQIFAWQHQYDSTHIYCQKVIQQGGYSLESMDNYANIWKGKVSSESIFELPMKYNADDPNFKSQNDWAEAKFDFFGTFLKGDLVDNKNTSCWVAPSGGIVDNTLFDTTKDLRFRRFFRKVAASGGDQAGYLLTKYTDFNYQNPDAKTNAYIDNDLVLIRLADIYLLDAEALAHQNDLAGAKDNLEKTESRAGIDSYKDVQTKNDVLTEILKERGRELIGEGIWYYDLIRTEPELHWLERVGYPADRVLPQNKGYYWPLNMNTLFPYDNLLTQNPWWSANADR
ncbi:RagB/SusD family nutrient uptake outer membrane protein [Arachidicoccus ginsenosidivorans]|uniref:RagB/SusD family nutrient uptake outer membrane protein n=2 Tax=Arachidicoccus ginsenosidivorans TaxID=496057 RepID=A0A5B8VJ11_9BACT|nr:RagB/SusD family nutrient uptake outer membrane protein [Arachidicoccus ginsenosidivorans]